MKVRLRHGAVAKQEKPVHASGFGIPVSLLTKVLHAPDLPRPDDEEFTSPKKHHHNGPFSDPNSLFPSDEDMQLMGMRKQSNKPSSSSSAISRGNNHHRGHPTSPSGGSNHHMGERRVQSAHTPQSPQQYEGSPGSKSSHERTIMSATGRKHSINTPYQYTQSAPYQQPLSSNPLIIHSINTLNLLRPK